MSVFAMPNPGAARPRLEKRDRAAAAVLTATGAGLVVAGVMLPWLSYYAGLFRISAFGTANGERLLALAGTSLALALAAAMRPRQAIRWTIALVGAVEVLFSAHLLSQLNSSLAAAGQMLVAKSGPGLYFALAGGVVTFTAAFLPLSHRPRRTRDAPRAAGGFAAHARPGGRSLAKRAGLAQLTAQRRLQIALGTLWLVDAALQSQPYMFTRSFATSTLAASARSSPLLLARVVSGLAHLVEAQPVVCNELFVVTELAIAVLLFSRRTVRVGLATSASWGLVVWVLGEGIGLLLPTKASPFAGSPGAGVLYVVASVLLWPAASGRSDPSRPLSVAESGPIGARAARATVIGLFILLACETWPLAATVRAAADMFVAMRQGEPGWIVSLDGSAASVLARHGPLLLGLAAAAFLVMGFAVASRTRLRRPAIALGLALAVALFLLEDLGGVATGYATDVSTAPVLALILASYWPRGSSQLQAAEVEDPLRPETGRETAAVRLQA